MSYKQVFLYVALFHFILLFKYLSAPKPVDFAELVEIEASTSRIKMSLIESENAGEVEQSIQTLASSVLRKQNRTNYFDKYYSELRALIQKAQAYPRRAKLLGHEGRVVLGLVINSKGVFQDVRVIESSGHRSLDDAAMRSTFNLSEFKKVPKQLGAELKLKIPIIFKLQ
jgi:protein TonB